MAAVQFKDWQPLNFCLWKMSSCFVRDGFRFSDWWNDTPCDLDSDGWSVVTDSYPLVSLTQSGHASSRPSLHPTICSVWWYGNGITSHSSVCTGYSSAAKLCVCVLARKQESSKAVYVWLQTYNYPPEENKCRVSGPLWKQDYSLWENRTLCALCWLMFSSSVWAVWFEHWLCVCVCTCIIKPSGHNVSHFVMYTYW